MKNAWTILCQSSSIDFESNLISAFNCIEELKLVFTKPRLNESEKTVIKTNLQLISLWTISNPESENTLDLKTEIIDPNGQALHDFKNNIPIKKGIKRFRNRINVQSIPITSSGRYYINTWLIKDNKFSLVAELPIDIDVSYKLS